MQQCDRVLATGVAPWSQQHTRAERLLGRWCCNAVITVDDTADLDDAATKIHMSKTLDLAASCSSDNSVILVDSIYEPMLERLKAKGGYLRNAEEKEKLQHDLG